MTPLLAVLIFLPLAFNPAGLSSFTLPKLWLVSLGVLLQGVVFLKQKKRLHLSLLSLTFFLYLIVLVFSASFSLSPLMAFKGSYTRWEGVLTAFIAFLFLLSVENEKRENIKLSGLLIAGVFTVTLALLPGAAKFFGSTDRAFSTLGQPNFFGAYLVMLLPLTFLLAFPWSVLTGLVLFLGIALSASRAALFALIPLLLGCTIAFRKQKFYLFVLAAGMATILVESLLQPSLRQRLSTLFSGRDPTAQVRLLVWDKATRILSRHPVLGVGPENFSFHFLKVKPAEINKLEGVQSFADRAHSLLLDEALKGGLAGFFLFSLFLCIGAFTITKQKENQLAEGCLLCLLGFVLVHLVSFPTLVPLFLLLFLLGLFSRKIKIVFPAKAYAAAAFPIFLFLSAYMLCDVLAKQGEATMNEDAVAFSLPPLDLATKILPFEPKYQFLAGQAAAHAFRQTGEKRFLRQAEEAFKKAQKLSPFDPFAVANLALVYAQMSRSSQKYEQKAEAYFSRATALFPTNAYFHQRWGVFLAERGKLKQAIQMLQRADRLDPENAEILSDLGLAYQRNGEYDQAIRCLKKSVRLKKSKRTLNNLGITYFKARKWEKARRAFLQVLDIDPNDAGAYNNLGAVYMKTGKIEKARKSFEAALRLGAEGQMGALARHNLALLKKR